MPETIGQRIRRTREAEGLRQADLAEMVGVSTTTYGKLENDKARGRALPAVLDVLDIDEAGCAEPQQKDPPVEGRFCERCVEPLPPEHRDALCAGCQRETEVKERKCLSCHRRFTSTWFGERICQRCKSLDDRAEV